MVSIEEEAAERTKLEDALEGLRKITADELVRTEQTPQVRSSRHDWPIRLTHRVVRKFAPNGGKG